MLIFGKMEQQLILEAPELNSVPGLVEALNGLTAGLDASVALELREKFDQMWDEAKELSSSS